MGDDRQEAATDSDRDMGAVAWIDVEADTEGPSDATLAAQAVTFVLRRIERAVRADDRVCPVSTQSVAVQFGTVASVVAPSVLGNRLAHAIGPNLPFNRSDANLAVAIGMAAPLSADGNATEVTGRARLAARSARRTLGPTSRVAGSGRHRAAQEPCRCRRRHPRRRRGAEGRQGLPDRPAHRSGADQNRREADEIRRRGNTATFTGGGGTSARAGRRGLR